MLGDVSRADRCLSVPQPRFTFKIIKADPDSEQLAGSSDLWLVIRDALRVQRYATRKVATHASCMAFAHPGRLRRRPVGMEPWTLHRKKTRMKGLALPMRVRLPDCGRSLVLRRSRTRGEDLPKSSHLSRGHSPVHGNKCWKELRLQSGL